MQTTLLGRDRGAHRSPQAAQPDSTTGTIRCERSRITWRNLIASEIGKNVRRMFGAKFFWNFWNID